MEEYMKVGVVEKMKGGSLYPVKAGKHTLGFAFSYSVDGSEKKRRVITGPSEKAIKEKVQAFLEKKNREYLREEEKKRREEEGKTRPLTFREAGERWFAVYKQGRLPGEAGLSYASVESRESSLKRINEAIGDMPLKDIDDNVAAELIRKCSAKGDGQYFSHSHVDKLQQVFRMVMRYGVENGHCEKVPGKVALSRNLTVPDKDARFLDMGQIKEILDAVQDNPRYSVLTHLLFATGLRQEEALALNMGDFKVNRKTGSVEVSISKTVVEKEGHVYEIVAETKTAQSKRDVYIPLNIYEKVKKYYEGCIAMETEEQAGLREEKQLGGYIFLNQDIQPLNKRTLERNYGDYLKRHGVKFKVTLHMFRHTYVSYQAEHVSLDKVALMIGDSLVTTNKMYQSITENTKEEICRNSTRYLDSVMAM